MVAEVFSSLRALQTKDGDTCSLIPGWAPLLTAFEGAEAADAAATEHLSYQPQEVEMSELPRSAAAEAAVKGIQLWAQSLRSQQQAWGAAAFTKGEINVLPST